MSKKDPKHIKIYKKHFGLIPTNFHVHHIDGDHSNNSPKNLIAISRFIHYWIHKNFPSFNLPSREKILDLISKLEGEKKRKRVIYVRGEKRQTDVEGS